jgi:LysM repeat protein
MQRLLCYSASMLGALVLALLLVAHTGAQVEPPGAPSTPPVTVTHTLSATVRPPLAVDEPRLNPYAPISATAALTNTPPPAYHVVQPGETLGAIALTYAVDLEALMAANGISDPDVLSAGVILRIPGGVGGEEVLASAQLTGTAPLLPRRPITERLTLAAQRAPVDSAYHRRTWVTFYGRPHVPIMGILGEHGLDRLTRLLKAQSLRYDRANGPMLDVMPAYHLVYGMATKAPGEDGSHLTYLSEDEVLRYIRRAQREGFGVILDVQIGAMTPVSATAVAFPFLRFENVHLAIDPEFAKVYDWQAWPGDPIGFVTAQQINEVQAAMQRYLEEHRLPGPRILLVHQFLDEMIVDKAQIDQGYAQVELTISVDGWGPPYGKITKYNLFVDPQTPFTSFKLFYRWDEPLLNERQALGEAGYDGTHFIEITPNMIIYQ